MNHRKGVEPSASASTWKADVLAVKLPVDIRDTAIIALCLFLMFHRGGRPLLSSTSFTVGRALSSNQGIRRLSFILKLVSAYRVYLKVTLSRSARPANTVQGRLVELNYSTYCTYFAFYLWRSLATSHISHSAGGSLVQNPCLRPSFYKVKSCC